MPSVKIDGTWREIDPPSVKIDGTWMEMGTGYCKVDGAWHEWDMGPSPIPVTITGQGDATYCYAIINGITYTSATTGIESYPGDTITLHVKGTRSDYGSIRLEGVDNSTNSSITKSWAVPVGCSSIAIDMACSTKYKYGIITVTTT